MKGPLPSVVELLSSRPCFLGHGQLQRALRFQACEKCSAWAASVDASGALGGEDGISLDSWTTSVKVLSPG